MRAVCFQSTEKVTYREIEDPKIQDPHDAIIQVEVAGLCGSDLHPFFGRERGLDAGTAMGHEFVGRVIEVGDQVHSLKISDRVFAPFSTSCGNCHPCRIGLTSRCEYGELFGWRSNGKGLHGGQAERVRVPLADSTLKIMQADMTAESALLLGDNLSTGFFCAEMAQPNPDGFYAVIGCGTVGTLALHALKYFGATYVLAIDPILHRLETARRLGFKACKPDDATQELSQMSGGRLADAVLELVGQPSAQELAFALVRPGGVLSVIGCHTSEKFTFSPVDAYDKNLTYKTGRCPARSYMDSLTDVVLAGRLQVDQLITHRFAPQDCVAAYDIFAHQRDGCVKAVFDFR